MFKILKMPTAVLLSFFILVSGLISMFAVPPQEAKASDNGLAQKPIMGWSSWSFIRKDPTEAKIKAQADVLAAKFKSHGYEYVNLDDFYMLNWTTNVDTYGRWVVDPARFPNGMKALGDYIHSLGLKFGIYVTPGIPKGAVDKNTPIEGTPYYAKDIADTTKTEKNYNYKNMYYIDYSKPGAQEFIDSWARLFASYGADFLKLDGVGDFDIPDIEAWSKALKNSGRPIHLALSNSLNINYGATWKQLANGWRTQGDVECYCATLTDWSHVSGRFNTAANWAPYAGPGGWSDFDSINVANGANDGLTDDEKQTYVSLWAIGASHFYFGSDLTNLDDYGVRLMTNDEIIAVNQSGVAGKRLSNSSSAQVFYQKLPDGSFNVALFSTGGSSANVTVNWSDLGIQGPAWVRDLWSHSEQGTFNTGYSAAIASHGSRVIKVTPLSALTVVPGNGAMDIDTAAPVNFSWAAVPNADSYRLTIADDSNFSKIVFNNTVNTVSKAVTGLQNDKQYFWRISAIAGGNEQIIGTFMFYTKLSVPPAAPSGVSVARTSASAAKLKWNNTFGASSYSVYKKSADAEGSGPYIQIASGITALEYTDLNAPMDTKYNYTVTASNSNGEGVPSLAALLADRTPAEIAAGITSLQAPLPDATSLALPLVPANFTVAIKSSDKPTVIGVDGRIVPPVNPATVTLVLEITRTFDNSKASTAALQVVVPAKSTITSFYEAENATLGSTTTKVSSCTPCSGGKKVGYIGNNAANYALFSNINAPVAGLYNLRIDYLTGAPRSFFISVNNGAGLEVPLNGPDFNTVLSAMISIELQAGSNTIKFYNNTAYGPDLDRIGIGEANAATVASKITSITAPGKDVRTLALPAVPAGYAIKIKRSDNSDVIRTDGTIIPPDMDMAVTLVLEVTKVSDGSTSETGAIQVVVPAKSNAVLTSAQVAAGITAIAAPAKDAVSLTLPSVPAGFIIGIKSSDKPDIIGLDGTITPPDTPATVTLVLEVTDTTDYSSTTSTAGIQVTVPAKSKDQQSDTVYLSDLNWISATSGSNRVNKDRNEQSTVNPIKINGVPYAKGIGTHVDSEIIYKLNGQFARFKAVVGPDDYTLTNPNKPTAVQFYVYGDGQLLFDSGIMRTNPYTLPKEIDVGTAGVNELKLVVLGRADGANPRVSGSSDWADARLIKGSQPPASPQVTLNGSDSVNTGGSFDLTIGAQQVKGSIYGYDLAIEVDPSQIDVLSAKALKDGLMIVDKKTASGQLRILAVAIGDDKAASANGDLLVIHGKAKSLAQSATASIRATLVVANGDGAETQLDGVFHDLHITYVDKALLNDLIASAQSTVNAAVEGTQPGQYPAGSKAALSAAIESAQAVAGNSAASQQQVEQAAVDLGAALQAFKASVITGIPGDVNGDGKVSIGDLAIAAKYYGKSSADSDWDQYKFADLNHDGVIDITDLAMIAQKILDVE
ncbi:NPCBM/NEW2 domain-containing protein [Paenibacillus planticolens]|nr:NPCBM/NEW2 domain-containing protein [Paenibacillus planticolens]